MSEPLLRIAIRPAPVSAGLFAVAHLLALIAAAASLSGWPLALVATGIFVSGIGTLADILQLGARAATAIEVAPDGRAAWCDRRGTWHRGRLAAGGFASSWLVLVPIGDAPRGRKWLLLTPESVPGDELRRLRVRLRWGENREDAAQDRKTL